MGEVYRARDTRLGREVAVKLLPSVLADDPDRRARLERESRLLAALNHPHIAAIHSVEEIDGRLALILELVARRSPITLRRDLFRVARRCGSPVNSPRPSRRLTAKALSIAT
jgi:serine/threonine protein kinase